MLTFIILAACLGILAQSISGDLVGRIYDASGDMIPGVTIVAKNDATGTETTTKSTSSGESHVAKLQPGMYRVTVRAAGFAKAQIKGVSVALNQTATTNVRLDVSGNVETVEVSASAASIDTTTASVQTAFQGNAMSELPIASGGSGVLNLALLNAGGPVLRP